MTEQGKNRRGNRKNAGENARQGASSGPLRGYIPGRDQVPGQQNGPAAPGYSMEDPGQYYYPGNAYYNNAAPNQGQPSYNGQNPLNGSQRGFIMPPARNDRKQKKEKKGGSALPVIALVLVLAVLATGGYFAVSSYMKTKMMTDKVMPYAELFCPGVYVDGIDLGGMTPEQAMNSVQSQIRQRNDAWKVQLTYNGSVAAEIDAKMLNFTVDPAAVMNKALMQGHEGDLEQRYEAMLRLEQEPYMDYTAMPQGDTGVIDAVLVKIKESIDRPAVDAELTGFDKTLLYPFLFSDEQEGYSLDIEPVKEKLYKMASTMESGTVELVPEVLEPSVTKGKLMKNYRLRADVSTPIDKHSDNNRNNNIRRAFEFFNGAQLNPGETFSFNNWVGPRTQENGFYPATEYVYGEHTEGYGGGVCQASSTLYQAAVCAGLQIKERKPHSDSVSYAEYGKDATVYLFNGRGGKKIDLKFVNSTEQPIYILAFVEPDPGNKKRLRARVIIYGQDMGNVRYELQTVEIETITCTEPPKYVAEKSQAASAKDGHVVMSYRVEYNGSVETGRKELFKDVYEPIPQRIYDPSRANSR